MNFARRGRATDTIGVDRKPADRKLWRDVAAGAAIAAVTSVVSWMLQYTVADPQPASRCVTAGDAAAVVFAALVPNAPLGAQLVYANRILLAFAAGIAPIAMFACTQSWAISAAVGLAIAAALPAVPRAPFDPLMLPIAMATILALARERARSGDPTWWGSSGLALTAFVVPSASLPIGVMGALRKSRLVLGACLVSLFLPFVVSGLPSGQNLFACAAFSGDGIRAWLAGWRWTLGSAGPYAVGLAAFGGFTIVMRVLRSTRGGAFLASSHGLLAAYILVVSLTAHAVDRSSLMPFSAALAAFWMCAAVGLRELVRACGTSVWRRAAAAGFVVLLPAAQIAGLEPSVVEPESYGTDRISAAGMRRMLERLPPKSLLIDDDATIAALLRATRDTWARRTPHLGGVPRSPAAIRAVVADADMRVFTLPWTQSLLQWRGFRLRDADVPGVRGVAEVGAAERCEAIATRWLDATGLAASASTSFAVVTRDFGAAHAIVLYASGAARTHPALLDHPPGARVGFHAETYTTSNARDRDLLETLTRDDRLPPRLSERLGDFIVRAEIWREAGLPAVISFDLGAQATGLFVRRTGDGGGDEICPAFPFERRTIEIAP